MKRTSTTFAAMFAVAMFGAPALMMTGCEPEDWEPTQEMEQEPAQPQPQQPGAPADEPMTPQQPGQQPDQQPDQQPGQFDQQEFDQQQQEELGDTDTGTEQDDQTF